MAAEGSRLTTPWAVRCVWVGGPLSELEWACIASFVAKGAAVELFTDDISRPVPRGVRTRALQEIPGVDVVRYGPRAGNGAGSYAMTANTARLSALYHYGGWWIDTDVLCLRAFDAIDSGYRFGLEVGTIDTGKFNVAVLRMPARTAVGRTLLRRARYPLLGSPWESLRQRVRSLIYLRDTLWNPGNVPWGWSAGPPAFTAAIRHFGLQSSALPISAFYPVPYEEWDRIPKMDSSDIKLLAEDSYCIHLWSEMYRRHGADKGQMIRNAPWAGELLEDYPGRG